MKHKVIITGEYISKRGMELLASHDIEVATTPPYTSSHELSNIINEQKVSGIILRTGHITKEVIDASPTLRVIAKHGVGVDNIDIKAAIAKDIMVMITPNANTRSVSELSFSMIMSLLKHINPLQKRIRNGFWDKSTDIGTELTGKHLGIIGRGDIALDLVKLVAPFKMKISAFVRTVEDTPALAGIHQYTDFNKFLQSPDIVSIHCPLTGDTRGLFKYEQFKKMKSSSILINTSRGAIIEESSLFKALTSGEISGAGLDCFEVEPPNINNPLFALPNIIMTPHIGFSTHDSLDRMGILAAKNIISVLVHKSPIEENLVPY